MTSVPPFLFVTGTDTEVGKTVVTAALAASLPGNVRALKPVATGVSDGSAGEDAELLGRAAGHERCYGVVSSSVGKGKKLQKVVPLLFGFGCLASRHRGVSLLFCFG